MNEQKKINIMLAVLFIVLVIAIVIVIADPTKKPNQFVYNGFVVTRFRIPSAPSVVFHGIDLSVGNKLYNIPIRNNPADLESIGVSGLDQVSWLEDIEESDNYDITADLVYVTFDPFKMTGSDVLIAGGEIVRMIGSGEGGIYHRPVSAAFTQPMNNSATLVRDCQDANSKTGIIKLQLGNENKIYAQDDCIIIQAESLDELIKSSERFMLTILGVIKL